MTRRFLRSMCRALVGAVLFAQLMVSAYACPGLSPATMQMPATLDHSATDTTLAATDQRAMDCAGMAGPMDPEFANLCAEHCHHDQQSDQAAALTVPAATLNALYLTPLTPQPVVAAGPSATATDVLAAASPPLAILHCCFRI